MRVDATNPPESMSETIRSLRAELSQLREENQRLKETNANGQAANREANVHIDNQMRIISDLQSAIALKDTALDKIEFDAPQCWWCGAVWQENAAGELAKEHEWDCIGSAARKAGHE